MQDENLTTAVKKQGRTYPKNIRDKCVELLKEGKKVNEVIEIVSGPKRRAILRYAKKAGLEIKE